MRLLQFYRNGRLVQAINIPDGTVELSWDVNGSTVFDCVRFIDTHRTVDPPEPMTIGDHLEAIHALLAKEEAWEGDEE